MTSLRRDLKALLERAADMLGTEENPSTSNMLLQAEIAKALS